MNIYRTQFSRLCPINGDRIFYSLKIKSASTVMAEDIKAYCDALPERATQEDIADRLFAGLPGRQIIWAQHRGIHIKTVRDSHV